MRKLLVVAAAGLFIAGFAGNSFADDEDGYDVTFGASASYTYDFNDPDVLNQPGGSAVNQLTYGSREQDESFNIDLVQIGVTGQRGPVMYGAKVDFGDLATLAGDSSDGDVALQEAYLAIETMGLTVTAGRFATPIGYEVMEPWANANISRSVIWNFMPVNHDGLMVGGSAGPVDLAIGVVNGFTVADPIANNPDDEYGFIASLGTNVGGIDLNLAAIYTEEQQVNDVFEINAIGSGSCGNCRYALEFTYLESDLDNNSGATSLPIGDINDTNAFGNSEDFDLWDITAYFGMSPCERWNIDARFSWTDWTINNYGGYALSSNDFSDQMWSVTLTAGYDVTEDVQARIEYRHDEADDSALFADDDSTGSNPDRSIDLVNMQLVWAP